MMTTHLGRYAYDTLVTRVSALTKPSSLSGLDTLASSPTLLSAPRQEADFPQVSFWTRDKWTTWEKTEDGISNSKQTGGRGGSRMADGMNISMRYVENEDGNIINGFRVKTILKFAHSVFFQLRDHNKHPKTWGAAGIDIVRAFCEEMEHQFPELALCADHWKAQYLASKNYSSWYSTHGKPPAVKVEAESNSGDTGIDLIAKSHGKRRADEDSRSTSKKLKSEPQPVQDSDQQSSRSSDSNPVSVLTTILPSPILTPSIQRSLRFCKLPSHYSVAPVVSRTYGG